MTLREPMIAVLAAASAAACSPTLEWREFVPEGSGLGVTFPCRPDRHARTVAVAGANARMEMLVCTAGGATYALSFFDVVEPERISAALADLRASAVANVEGQARPGQEGQPSPLQIKGMTANDNAVRLTIAGRLPDGAAVQEQAAFFTRGLRVYQATVIGAALQPQAVETFFGGLSFPE
jgi:hypothetical protein